MSEAYADIINLPGPQHDELFLRRHPRMPLRQRAKIFSPFAALVGYDQYIRSKEVPYEPKRELGLEDRQTLNRQLQWLAKRIPNSRIARERPLSIKVEYFSPCTDPLNDAYGVGGLYKTVSGTVRRVDPVHQVIDIEDVTIPFDDIYRIGKI